MTEPEPRQIRILIMLLLVFIGLAKLSAAEESRAYLSPKIKFRPDGKFITTSVGERMATREEGSVNGVAYSFYHSDGSGSFGKNKKTPSGVPTIVGLSLSCKQDPMTDTRSCTAISTDEKSSVNQT
jgi:hypothetical protein